MAYTVTKLTYLLEHLEKEDYDKVISYIEFLVDARAKKQLNQKKI